MNLRPFVFITLVSLLSILFACGGNAGPAANNTPNPPGNSGSGGGSGSPPPATPPGTGTSSGADLIYVSNQSSGSVSGWSFDQASGKAAGVPGSPFASGLAPAAMTFSPDGKYFYVVDSEQPVGVRGANCDLGSTQLTSYSVDHSSGSLAVAGRLTLQTYCGWGVAIDSSGKYLYVPGQTYNTVQGAISEISLDGTGQMKEIAGSPYLVPQNQWPYTVVVAPNGTHLYATMDTADQSTGVLVFSRDPNTGAVQYQASAANGPQASLAMSSSGTTLVTTSFAQPQMTVFKVDPASGGLTQTGSFPVAANHVRQVSADPAGNFMAVATDDGVFVYSVTGAGAVSPVSGSPFGGNAVSSAYDKSGTYLSMLGPGSGSTPSTEGNSFVSVWKVDTSSGKLTQVTSGLETQQYPAQVVMTTK